jgi:hypothetical protein
MMALDRASASPAVADQRYYHFVVVRETKHFGLDTYWRLVGDIVTPGYDASTGGQYPIEHKKLRLATGFARGAVAAMLSETNQVGSAYLYDLFAARIRLDGDWYLLFGFPFVALASTVVQRVIDTGNVLAHGKFIGVDIPKLIDVMERGITDRFANLSTHVVGIQFIVKDDKSLTAVRLGGKDPLSAQIYTEFLGNKKSEGLFLPDRCVLACEREWSEREDRTEVRHLRAYRSRLHVDAYGNFRFYAHVSCANIRLLPYALGQLLRLGCLSTVRGNPLCYKSLEDE